MLSSISAGVFVRAIFNWGCQTIKDNERAINEKIKVPTVRLVGAGNEQLGVMQRTQAQQMANDQGLDLVLMAPEADPPVCRIMDFGKYVYEKTKREKEARKNQKIVEVKEVQLSVTIEDHDTEIKAKAAAKFIEEGNKIKVSIRFRGRQMAHPEIGIEVMNGFLERLGESVVVDRRPLMEGRTMIMMLSPNPKANKIK